MAGLTTDFQRKNDLISWLLEIAVGEQRTTEDLTLRILAINMAAIHTSSMVCLYVITPVNELQCVSPRRPSRTHSST
jgi:hypothetical protein